MAITLAWVAGYTDVVGLLALGSATSHVTGAASSLGRGVVGGMWNAAGFEFFVLGTFLVGAAISGAATELGKRKAWESIYVLPMAIEAVLLAAFAIGIELREPFEAVVSAEGPRESAAPLVTYVLVGLGATAMGLQNATITMISSGAVRTTHVTGVLTDVGTSLVNSLLAVRTSMRGSLSGRERLGAISSNTHVRHFALLVSILGSFVLGAALGAIAYDHVSARWAMFVPVMFLVWIIAQDIKRPIAEIEPSALIATEHIDLPDSVGVFRLVEDHVHKGVQRLPDLVAWIDRLPAKYRVVVIDLADVQQLEQDAGFQVRAALARMKESQRVLILAGVSPSQFQHLRDAGAGMMLTADNVCPDVELAIARALAVLE